MRSLRGDSKLDPQMKSAKRIRRPTKGRIVAKHLADDLDVSVSTISRAFTEGAVISPKTRAKVLERAKAVGYQPNPYAQSLITRRSNIVGIIVSHFENPFYSEAVTGLCEALRLAGLSTMFFSVPAGETSDEILPQVLAYHPEIVVVMTTTISSRAMDKAAKSGTNLIFFNRYIPHTPSFCVTCDNDGGGRAIANHLLDNGHSRMAYIAGVPNATTTIDRWKGFSESCAARGITEVLREEGHIFSYETGYQATLRLMKAPKPPDAIFGASDILAIGALDALRTELGLRVPEDVSVAGFDNISMADWPSHSLTTYHHPIAEMVTETVSLIGRIFAEPDIEPEFVTIPGRMVIRNSTRRQACKPARGRRQGPGRRPGRRPAAGQAVGA